MVKLARLPTDPRLNTVHDPQTVMQVVNTDNWCLTDTLIPESYRPKSPTLQTSTEFVPRWIRTFWQTTNNRELLTQQR